MSPLNLPAWPTVPGATSGSSDAIDDMRQLQPELRSARWFSRRRTPLVMQAERSECGLACLAMIAGYHGLHVGLNALRETYGISAQGAGLHALLDIAQALKLHARPLRLEPEELESVQLPAVLHWDMNHYVVLTQVSRRGITILNPAIGERRYSWRDAAAHITGVALELVPTSDFAPADIRVRMKLRDLWDRCRGFSSSLVQVFVLSLLLQVFALASPFYVQVVVDDALLNHDADLISVLALGFALVTLFNVSAGLLRSWVLLHFAQSLGVQIAAHLHRHLLHLPLSWFEKRHTGDVMSRFGSLEPLRKLLSEDIVTTLVDGLMVLLTLAMMLLYAPVLTAVVVAAVVLYAVLRLLTQPRLRALSQEQIAASAKAQSQFIEGVRGMLAIKVFGLERIRQTLWRNREIEVMNSSARVALLGITMGSANSLLFGLEQIVVVYLGAHAVLDGALSVGMLYAFIAYKSQFTGRISALVDRLSELLMAGLHLERLSDIGLHQVESDEQHRVVKRPLQGALGLREIGFRYGEDRPAILNSVSIDIAPGEHVAIVGASGSGKTTLLKIMMGLVAPAHGQLLVDGSTLNEFGITDFRHGIAAVMQDDVLFAGTLADNITLFAEHADLPRMVHCAELTGLDDEIRAMSMQYDTLVGDMGSALSGGQRQRLLLARALYRQPKVLFLDEWSAHLDDAATTVCCDALQAHEGTLLMITHDMRLLERMDRVLRVAGGTVTELVDVADRLGQENELR